MINAFLPLFSNVKGYCSSEAELTCVGKAVAVGPGRRGSVAGLHFQSVRCLFLAIKHDLGEDFARLLVDLEVIFAFVTRRVHDPVIHLIGDSFPCYYYII